jgi:hypothetical protein
MIGADPASSNEATIEAASLETTYAESLIDGAARKKDQPE